MNRLALAFAVTAALAVAAACTGSDPDPVNPSPSPSPDDVSFDGAVPSTDDQVVVDGGTSVAEASVIPVVEAGAWTPSDLGASAVLWLKGDDGIVAPAAGPATNVQRWTDTRSGEFAAQTNALLQPTVAPVTFHDHKAVRFSPKCNMLGFGDRPSVQFAGGTFTVAVVAAFRNKTVHYPGNFIAKVDDISPHAGFLLRVVPDGQSLLASVDLSGAVASGAGNLSDDHLHRVVYRRRDSTLLDLVVDDQKSVAVATKDVVDVSAVKADVRIGAERFSGDKFQPSDCLDGDIAEILLVNTALSDADVGLLEAYFKQKYAL